MGHQPSLEPIRNGLNRLGSPSLDSCIALGKVALALFVCHHARYDNLPV